MELEQVLHMVQEQEQHKVLELHNLNHSRRRNHPCLRTIHQRRGRQTIVRRHHIRMNQNRHRLVRKYLLVQLHIRNCRQLENS